MEITFSNYFRTKTAEMLDKLGQDNLTQGCNFVHKGKTYNIKLIEPKTEFGERSYLLFKVYTTETLLFYRKYGNSSRKPKFNVAHTGPEFNLMRTLHEVVEIDKDIATPVFAGVFTPKIAQVYKDHPELAPEWTKPPRDQPPPLEEEPPLPLDNQGYSRTQKAFALFVSAVCLSTVAYGIHKVRKGDITLPTRKGISDYLSQLKEKWMPQEGVKA